MRLGKPLAVGIAEEREPEERAVGAWEGEREDRGTEAVGAQAGAGGRDAGERLVAAASAVR